MVPSSVQDICAVHDCQRHIAQATEYILILLQLIGILEGCMFVEHGA